MLQNDQMTFFFSELVVWRLNGRAKIKLKASEAWAPEEAGIEDEASEVKHSCSLGEPTVRVI